MRWLALVVVCGCKFAATDGVRPIDAAGDGAIDSPVVDPDAPDAMPPIDWLHPYAHRKAITLHKELVAGALADFPVAIVVTDNEIAAGAKPMGEDIAFTAGDALTPLPYEIESFSKTSKQLVAWVKVPALSNAADTTLYVYYGRTNPPANDGTKVWTEYEGVWHLQQDPGPGGNGDIKDATSKHHDGTPAQNLQSSDLVQAQVGNGIQFDGNQDFIAYGGFNLGNSFTVSAWIRYTNHANVNAIFANSGSGFDTDGFRFFVNTVNTSNRRLSIEVGSGNIGSGKFTDTNDNVIPVAVFSHVACVVDRTTGASKLYVDGELVGQGNVGTTFNANSTFDLGRMQNNLFFFDGIIDEVEVAKAQRPIEWLKTAHDTQAHPEMFISLATEENEPPQ